MPSPDVAAASEAAPRGAATLTDGLDPLDRERASSLADEGGTAGAAVEAQSPGDTHMSDELEDFLSRARRARA